MHSVSQQVGHAMPSGLTVTNIFFFEEGLGVGEGEGGLGLGEGGLGLGEGGLGLGEGVGDVAGAGLGEGCTGFGLGNGVEVGTVSSSLPTFRRLPETHFP